MSIHTLESSIFKSPAKILVNPVNAVGVMGKGLALEFKNRYPAMFEHYKQVCAFGDLHPGELLVWSDTCSNNKIKNWEIIVNFPTKRHWKQKSTLGIVRAGLVKLASATKDPGFWLGKRCEAVAIPKLGCGEGGLEWGVVREMIHEHLGGLNIKIYLHV